MEWICSGIALFFISGILTLFIPESRKGTLLSLGFGIAQILILPSTFSVLLSGVPLEYTVQFSEPIGSAVMRLDPLASFFLLLISSGSFLAAVYSNGYMKMYVGEEKNLAAYYFFLGFLASAMGYVVVIQNAVLFLVAWECMSLASYFLVSFEHKKEDVRKTGVYYFVAMQVSAAFLLTAFGWTSAISGSFDFQTFRSVISTETSTGVLLGILFFIGFGVKAGFVPFHTWLPRAHPAAPTGVSALMSGVMIKTGLYGILRIILLGGFHTKAFAYGVLVIALVTGWYGIANAIAQKDLKRLLAFSSIENIGIIGIGIGIGLLGYVYENALVALAGLLGAFLHTLNHFAFKSILFYSAGIVYQETHTRNIEQLGGLAKYVPLTAVLFLSASLAISGMPFFSGFVSEFLLYVGIAKSISAENLALTIVALVAFTGLACIGAMALLCFTRAYGIVFLGIPRSSFHHPISEKGKFSQLFPAVVLFLLVIGVGFFSYLLFPVLMPLVRSYFPFSDDIHFQSIEATLKDISFWLSVFLAITLSVIFLRKFLLGRRRVEFFKTWDCGYQTTSSRLQYTGSSFAQFFLELVSHFVPQKEIIKQEHELFPAHMMLESLTHDFSERVFVHPLLSGVNKFLARFSWIQSGKLQQYILYGLLFLVVLLIWIWSTL